MTSTKQSATAKGQPQAVTAQYEELVQRNWGFISVEEQEQISKFRVFLAGCGLGSNVAVLAARTGFCQFILADGDKVELSNLNRQSFRREHVGKNKAEATASLVKEVNPQAHVQVVPAFIGPDDTARLVQQCDVVVNMIDPGPALKALLDAARKQDKITLFPLNVAFGGLVLAFGPTSPSIEELVGSEAGSELFLQILQKLLASLPKYLWQYIWVAQRMQQEKVPPPQLGVAASITSALVVGAIMKVAIGVPVPLLPEVMALDTREPALIAWPIAR